MGLGEQGRAAFPYEGGADPLALGDGQIRTRARLLENQALPPQQAGALGREARPLKTVARERLCHETDPHALEDHATPQVPVGRIAARLVETTAVEEAGPTHSGEAEDEVPLEDDTTLVVDLEGPAPVVAPSDDA